MTLLRSSLQDDTHAESGGKNLGRWILTTAILCLLVALTAGGAGWYKAVVEHQEVQRLRAIKEIHQKLKADADRIDAESNTYIGSALAQSVGSTAQFLIESTQTLIDQHFHQEEIGYGLLVVCAVLLVASFVLFRKHAKGGMMSTKDPTSEGEPPQIDSVAPPEREDNRPTNQNTHSGNVPLIISGCVLAIAIIAIIASNSTRTQSPTSGSSIGAQNSASSASTPSVPESDWQVNSETNPVTGIIKKVATLKYRDKQNIIIRLNGKKLDCYITTDEFLETIDNMHSRVSTVQYKFDDGKVIRQGWTISDDNTALFYPGNCSLLITQLRTAKTLAFEYRPSEKIPETITFNVAGFPEDFKAEEPKAKSIKHVVSE